ncbi:YceH family protein [Planctomycetota bacterium]
MDICLTCEEARVLGCLLEKKRATPEYYPLSLNALVNACNQKVNRDPVVHYDEPTVEVAIEGLRVKKLIWINNSGRVDKYSEGLVERFRLPESQEAVLCILLLRGPQTVGEIRGRTDRLYTFDDLDAVQHTLSRLTEKEFVEQAPRAPGQKERRFHHLMSPIAETPHVEAVSDSAPIENTTEDDNRIDELEAKVAHLSEQLTTLQQAFDQFKKQFE